MKDGNYTIYVLQCRWAAETPWLKPDEPLVETPDKEWMFASKDFFGYSADHSVYCQTGWSGWWYIDEARRELSTVRNRDEEGDYDCKDNYRKKCRGVRHQFRIVKLELSQKTTLV